MAEDGLRTHYGNVFATEKLLYVIQILAQMVNYITYEKIFDQNVTKAANADMTYWNLSIWREISQQC